MKIQDLGCAGAVAAATLGVLAFGCRSAAEADPHRRESEERRLMEPFAPSQILVADEFTITMTANFFGRFTSKLVSPTQKQHRTPKPDGGSTYEFLDTAPVTPMRFQIGNTQLLVNQRLELEILGGTHAFTLNASGTNVSRHAASQTQFLGDVEIADGMFRKGS